MNDLERLTDEFCDGYLEGDASWTEALTKDELVELMHQLWPVMRNIPLINEIPRSVFSMLSNECEPYYKKVAAKLAQDRIDTGDL